jgi:serine protease Do
MLRPGFFAFIGLVAALAAQTREQKVRADRDKVVAEGFWIYNDLEKGLVKARETGNRYSSCSAVSRAKSA